jgi:hypothetical protein
MPFTRLTFAAAASLLVAGTMPAAEAQEVVIQSSPLTGERRVYVEPSPTPRSHTYRAGRVTYAQPRVDPCPTYVEPRRTYVEPRRTYVEPRRT